MQWRTCCPQQNMQQEAQQDVQHGHQRRSANAKGGGCLAAAEGLLPSRQTTRAKSTGICVYSCPGMPSRQSAQALCLQPSRQAT